MGVHKTHVTKEEKKEDVTEKISLHKGDKLQKKTEMKLKAAVEAAVKGKVESHKGGKVAKKDGKTGSKAYYKVSKDKSKAPKVTKAEKLKVEKEKGGSKYGTKITNKLRNDDKKVNDRTRKNAH